MTAEIYHFYFAEMDGVFLGARASKRILTHAVVVKSDPSPANPGPYLLAFCGSLELAKKHAGARRLEGYGCITAILPARKSRQLMTDENAWLAGLAVPTAATLGKSPGQLAYEKELAVYPNYGATGHPRPPWFALPRTTQATWEKNPTPRIRANEQRAAARRIGVYDALPEFSDTAEAALKAVEGIQ